MLSLFKKVWNKMKSAAKWLWNGIKKAFKKVIDFFKKVGSKIKGFFSSKKKSKATHPDQEPKGSPTPKQNKAKNTNKASAAAHREHASA